MRERSDPRHKARQKTIQELFALSFASQKTSSNVKKIIANLTKIDTIIREAASEFPIDKINKIDLVILRLAIYELLFEAKEPPRVIIDEAVELGKEFGGDTSSSFVNGVLGKIYERERKKIGE
ncbi:transcription antitermination factor NusB [Candidatus Microgenomates bacterium]|nr:transcription antitermination factor NusB [Candidatus Microgenomates bacterium]